jgi:thiol:disulfide interchange protein DsbC
MRWWAVVGILAIVAPGAQAAPDRSPAAAPARDAAAAHVREVLAQRYPDATIEAVYLSTDIPGWYEVVTSADIAYSNPGGELLLIGRLIDSRTKEDLSARHWSQLHAIDFRTLPLERAIKTVHGNGSRVLAVFADPDCPYCRKLERELQGAKDLTVYTFLFPIAELHPEAGQHSEQIWCSADAAKSWAGWVLDRTPLPAAGCANAPIAELAALGARLKITATPTMFTADGTRIVGAVDMAELERRLAAPPVAPTAPAAATAPAAPAVALPAAKPGVGAE